MRRAASALIGGITVGSLFQEQKVFDVVIWGRPDIRKDLNDVQNLMIDTESGTQVRLGDVARVDIAATPSVIHRQNASRRIDVEAEVSGRSLGAVTEEAKRGIKEGAFPFEYHAEVLGEHVERQAALGSLYSYLVAAAIAIVLLLQAALGSWRLAGLVFVAAPVAVARRLRRCVSRRRSPLARLVPGTCRGSRSCRAQWDHADQALPISRTAGSGATTAAWCCEATGERLPAVVATAITIGLIVLPFAWIGNVAGLEILHPAAVVILGGLVTSTILTLFVIPALYPRFAAKVAAETAVLVPEAAA